VRGSSDASALAHSRVSTPAKMPPGPCVASAVPTAAASTGLREPCAGDERQCEQNHDYSLHLSFPDCGEPDEKV
jgi:hypothetical protein